MSIDKDNVFKILSSSYTAYCLPSYPSIPISVLCDWITSSVRRLITAVPLRGEQRRQWLMELAMEKKLGRTAARESYKDQQPNNTKSRRLRTTEASKVDNCFPAPPIGRQLTCNSAPHQVTKLYRRLYSRRISRLSTPPFYLFCSTSLQRKYILTLPNR